MIHEEMTSNELVAFSELINVVLGCARGYREMGDDKREEEAKKVLDGLLKKIL